MKLSLTAVSVVSRNGKIDFNHPEPCQADVVGVGCLIIQNMWPTGD